MPLELVKQTLWRRLTEQNVTLSPYIDICDHDLDQIVSRIQHGFPNTVLVMIQGHLLSEKCARVISCLV